MCTWRKAAVIGGLFVVCTASTPAQAQTGSRLAWDHPNPSGVTGYAVTIDGVRTDHRLAPLSTNGTCGCSFALPFSGGRHTMVVAAYNSTGETASAPYTVGPTANAGGPYSASTGATVTVTGASSNAPTGSLTWYTWRWGDGTADTSLPSASASHVYAASGTFAVTLTVTDNAGATASATTSAAISTTSQTPLPAPWLTRDIGNIGVTGSASYSSGVFWISGAGDDIWNSADGFRYVYQPLDGDGQIVARVVSMQNTNTYAKAGVMIRESVASGSSHAIVNLVPSGSIEFLTRTSTGEATSVAGTSTQAPPAWVKLARSGNSIVASVSANGSSWSVVGTQNVTMNAAVLVGLAVTSHSTSTLNASVFDNVTVTQGSATQPPASPASPTPADSATGVAMTAGLTWSAVGATSYDLSFGTAYPPPQVTTGLTTASYQPASTSGNTKYYWRIVARNAAGTTTGPVWSFTTAPVTSGAVPAPWVAQDVGAVGQSGHASYSSGTFTVTGSGADIWGTNDSFYYVHQPLAGDGQIVARVTSLQNTHPSAKAGIMIRATDDAQSAHVILDVKPDGYVEFMQRSSSSGDTTYITGASQSVPSWLKLVRTGSTMTGYVSANGTAWTQVGSTSVSLGTNPRIGLVVTSHDSGVLNTATFDSVGVTGGGTAPPPPTSNGDVVIRASEIPASALHGSWQKANDSLSPDGVKLTSPDSGIAITSAPLSTPTHYVDVTFNAVANTPYRLWLRVQAQGDSKWNDSLWVQFSDAMAGGSPIYRINTTSGLLVNLATSSSGSSLNEWGWQNSAYWLSQSTVFTFPTSGMHTIRIQVREDGVQLDQIVLSPGAYMSDPPGPVASDSTIVPIQ